MFLVVFRYHVDPARLEAFEAVYRPAGDWSRFFAADQGYKGSELARRDDEPGRYIVIDRWMSAAAYRRFLEEHHEEYERRSVLTRALYLQEEALGAFETVGQPPEVARD